MSNAGQGDFGAAFYRPWKVTVFCVDSTVFYFSLVYIINLAYLISFFRGTPTASFTGKAAPEWLCILILEGCKARQASKQAISAQVLHLLTNYGPALK